MAKACEECTQNCLVMHKRNKNPAPVVTTFFKVMMGEDYSKRLLLPPVFARRAKKLVDKTTRLEDFNGEKWNVKFTKIDDHLAFKEGWDTFALAHGLQQGDFLVFHYIMKSHFVVLMYGSTGCPENRHFGIPHHPVKETKKNNNNNNNLIGNGQSPSEVLTNCNNFSHESSSKSEPVVDGVNHMKTSNMSPDENTTNTLHLVAPSSRPLDEEPDQRSEPLVQNTDKETDQRSEPLVRNADKETDQTSEPLVKNIDKETDPRSESLVKNKIPDNMISKSPTTVKPFCCVDNGNVHDQDECRTKSLPPVVVGSDGGQKNNVAAGGGGSKFAILLAEKLKESSVRQSEVPQCNSMHKRPRPADDTCTPAKILKKEPDTSVSRLDDSGYRFTSTGISPKPMAERMEPVKKEPTMDHGSDGLMRKEPTMNHGSDGMMKKEPTMNHGSGGLMKKEPTMNHGSDGMMKKEPIMNHDSGGKMEPKLEPVDYNEAPLSDSSNTSFSAVMSSYQYLELPGWVKLKSKVILLRNGTDLWAVLYQYKFGLKALTQNWGTFAKAKGIKPGDKCEFVLESEPNSRFTCNVFDVRVTH